MKVKIENCGVHGEQNIKKYILRNEQGVQISCINYGCIITEILTSDRHGNYENIVLNFESPLDYTISNSPYLGAIVGRVAGRIRYGEFQIEEQKHLLTKNHNEHHLHGGAVGFSNVFWEAETFESADEAGVIFSYVSPDGEEGYPGEVKIKTTYTLNDSNEFIITYEAETDRTTLLNLTNHSYFNLSGNAKRTILQHNLKINSDKYLPLDKDFLPIGKLEDVTDTPFDFRSGSIIEEQMSFTNEQINLAGGYDHPFLLNKDHKSIVLSEKESGRKIKVETDEAGIVLYTANSFSEDLLVNGRHGERFLGICLETQGLPDAINHPSFPSIVVAAGEPYQRLTKYSFGLLD